MGPNGLADRYRSSRLDVMALIVGVLNSSLSYGMISSVVVFVAGCDFGSGDGTGVGEIVGSGVGMGHGDGDGSCDCTWAGLLFASCMVVIVLSGGGDDVGISLLPNPCAPRVVLLSSDFSCTSTCWIFSKIS